MDKTKEKLRRIVEGQDTRAGRWFDYGIQALILLSLITFPFQTVKDLPDFWRGTLRVSENIVVSIFIIEFLLRWWVAKSEREFWQGAWPYIDLAAILPTIASWFFPVAWDLRWLRIFRIFKLLRYFKTARDRFMLAFKEIWKELTVFLLFALGLIYVAAVLLYIVEKDAPKSGFNSVFDGLWWAVVTLTTVGYGDMVPQTILGKVLTFLILLVGLSIIAVPSGLLASGLTKAHREISADGNK
jgi:voltage-gated potassium channel